LSIWYRDCPNISLRHPTSLFGRSQARNIHRYWNCKPNLEIDVDLRVQIADFIALEDRLDNSLQRDLVKMEHVRMRLTHEPINTEIIDMELIELKFIFDRCMYLLFKLCR
jgi:hypothetical protein